jgi:uncharacterized membrane protein YhaH (DUF805 family)
MGPLDAIKTCLAKSFQFKGRASRSEFWWFAPIWTLLCLFLLWISSSFDGPSGIFSVYLLAASVVSIPIWSSGFRRIQDTGVSGMRLLFPYYPLVFTCCAVWLGYVMPEESTGATQTIANYAIGLGIFLTLVSGIFSLRGLRQMGESFGQLIVSSDPHPNKYGPQPTAKHGAPNEVPQ